MLINSRIGLSLFSILGMLALMAGATFAFFSDTVTSNNNTFSTGILELKIADENEPFTDAVTQSTQALNMLPGGPVTESFLCFQNTGDIEIQEIITSMTATGNVNALAPWVNTVKVELGVVTPDQCDEFDDGETLTDFTSLYVDRFDADTNGVVSLKESLDQVNGDDRTNDDLLNGEDAFIPADPNTVIKFRTTWQLDVAAPNTAQGKTVNVNTTFVGNQEEN